MSAAKTYKRSENCELAYLTLAWNILDSEQRLDYEYVCQAPNMAGRVRSCVHVVRLGIGRMIQPQTNVNGGDDGEESSAATVDDILRSIVGED